MIGKLGVCAAALLAAGSALASETAGEEPDALSGFVETGETVNCVSMRSTSIDPIDEDRLLFKVGGRYFVNETRGACERADSTFFRLEARLFSPQACAGDILNVVNNQSGFFAGACSLGEFRALKKKPKEAPAEQTQ